MNPPQSTIAVNHCRRAHRLADRISGVLKVRVSVFENRPAGLGVRLPFTSAAPECKPWRDLDRLPRQRGNPVIQCLPAAMRQHGGRHRQQQPNYRGPVPGLLVQRQRRLMIAILLKRARRFRQVAVARRVSTRARYAQKIAKRRVVLVTPVCSAAAVDEMPPTVKVGSRADPPRLVCLSFAAPWSR